METPSDFVPKIDRIIRHNVAEIIAPDHLRQRLQSGTPLQIKLGVDPTKPDLHLGHAVVLWKLKEFQDLGHTVIFLVGDYTARIGDPSGRNVTRPVLSEQEIKVNTRSYLKQVKKILDTAKCEIRYNSEWFKKMKFADIIKLLAQTTVAQIIDREDFQQRLQAGHDIGLHELLYPVMQGYDSIQLQADVEMGGMDQKLNMLMGRQLQKKLGLPEQDIMIMPLLIGTDGSKKMSKSLGNYIGIAEKPAEQFGKIMSLPDNLMLDYWKLCTNLSDSEIDSIVQKLQSPDTNPRDIKLQLAKTIVTLYHGATVAGRVERAFNRTFRERAVPAQIPTIQLASTPLELVDLLVAAGLVESKAEARRMIEQKAVKINQQLMTDPIQQISPISGMVIQIGKRKFIKIA